MPPDIRKLLKYGDTDFSLCTTELCTGLFPQPLSIGAQDFILPTRGRLSVRGCAFRRSGFFQNFGELHEFINVASVAFALDKKKRSFVLAAHGAVENSTDRQLNHATPGDLNAHQHVSHAPLGASQLGMSF